METNKIRRGSCNFPSMAIPQLNAATKNNSARPKLFFLRNTKKVHSKKNKKAGIKNDNKVIR